MWIRESVDVYCLIVPVNNAYNMIIAFVQRSITITRRTFQDAQVSLRDLLLRIIVPVDDAVIRRSHFAQIACLGLGSP